MRKFDEELLSILRTETAYEKTLKSNAEERKRFSQDITRHSGDSSIKDTIKKDVMITRKSRYVTCPMYQICMVEMLYVVSGTACLEMNDEEILLHEGEIFLKNQYTSCGIRGLGENDIVLGILMKPRFLENAYICLKSNTVLSEFMLDTLRSEVSWNRFLHFSNITDLSILNLIETLAFAAFPYLDDSNIFCGSDPEPKVTEYMMTALLASLSRTLDTLAPDSSISYDEIIRKTVTSYIDKEYQTASLQELSRQVNQSESALSRQIKTLFGKTFKDLLLEKRFERAEMLLHETNLSVHDVALAVGYENTSFFYRRFRQLYGISPKDYRKT